MKIELFSSGVDFKISQKQDVYIRGLVIINNFSLSIKFHQLENTDRWSSL